MIVTGTPGHPANRQAKREWVKPIKLTNHTRSVLLTKRTHLLLFKRNILVSSKRVHPQRSASSAEAKRFIFLLEFGALNKSLSWRQP